jgi:hypothetical protein
VPVAAENFTRASGVECCRDPEQPHPGRGCGSSIAECGGPVIGAAAARVGPARLRHAGDALATPPSVGGRSVPCGTFASADRIMGSISEDQIASSDAPSDDARPIATRGNPLLKVPHGLQSANQSPFAF